MPTIRAARDAFQAFVVSAEADLSDLHASRSKLSKSVSAARRAFSETVKSSLMRHTTLDALSELDRTIGGHLKAADFFSNRATRKREAEIRVVEIGRKRQRADEKQAKTREAGIDAQHQYDAAKAAVLVASVEVDTIEATASSWPGLIARVVPFAGRLLRTPTGSTFDTFLKSDRPAAAQRLTDAVTVAKTAEAELQSAKMAYDEAAGDVRRFERLEEELTQSADLRQMTASALAEEFSRRILMSLAEPPRDSQAALGDALVRAGIVTRDALGAYGMSLVDQKLLTLVEARLRSQEETLAKLKAQLSKLDRACRNGAGNNQIRIDLSSIQSAIASQASAARSIEEVLVRRETVDSTLPTSDTSWLTYMLIYQQLLFSPALQDDGSAPAVNVDGA